MSASEVGPVRELQGPELNVLNIYRRPAST
jgi:hypothetical protein